jgi:geranylgeranyl pyrophosphate synthase
MRCPSGQAADLKVVPENRSLRETIRRAIGDLVQQLDSSYPLSKSRMEALTREVLARLSLHEGYLGWTMVMLLSAFWSDQVLATPLAERLLLLPANLDHGTQCGQAADRTDQAAAACLACRVEDYRQTAAELGYQVLITDRSAEMMSCLMRDKVGAVIGVAPLDLLERVIDKISLAGLPCQAAPLTVMGGQVLDEDWIQQMIRAPVVPSISSTRTYLHVMRAAARMFSPDELNRLAPRAVGASQNGDAAHLDPLHATEAIAYDFLAKGGKHSRPFITLAVYDALTGGQGTRANGAERLRSIPDAVRRAALSIETFHKASLVHDDIEDDDEFRYGDATLHRKYGTATAINVGDYLIGLGYRLVSRESGALGPDVCADILDCLARAHMRLSEGQGAELLWRDSHKKALSTSQAIRIYELKTAPAFEAALYAGMRMAGPLDSHEQLIGQFARHLGIAFQILNDLNDLEGDVDNKLVMGTDVLGGRPTVLWALALDHASEEQREVLQRFAAGGVPGEEILARVKALYRQIGVFDQAWDLVERHQQQATEIADQVSPPELQRLLHYLIEMVLSRPLGLGRSA